MTGWAGDAGWAVRRPPARQPGAGRGRGHPRGGRDRRRRHRPRLSDRARSSAVASGSRLRQSPVDPTSSLEAVTVKAIVRGPDRASTSASSMRRRGRRSMLASGRASDDARRSSRPCFPTRPRRTRSIGFGCSRSSRSATTGSCCTTRFARRSRALLRSSDPDRSRRYRAAAWRQLRDEVARASNHEMWRYTADLLYILAEPDRPGGLLPDDGPPRIPSETARPDDGPAVAAIWRAYMPPSSALVMEAWWRRMPQGVPGAARSSSATCAGFYLLAEMDQASHGLVEADPVRSAPVLGAT